MGASERRAPGSDRAGPRILMYSHDTFGLGHLRRTHTIAHALTSAFANASALIVSGSPIIGRFNFGPRVDFVRIPGVIKLQSGAYEPLGLPFHIDETIALRRSIIAHTVEAFRPDLVIVDKEPMGLRGEMVPALDIARRAGVPVVLGVRDVLDAPDQVRTDWGRRGSLEALQTFYDHVWIYGLEQIYDPLAGLDLGAAMAQRVSFTGYLRRAAAADGTLDDPDFLLVTAGGGGDGAGLMDWLLRVHEAGLPVPWPVRLVLGPFMDPEHRTALEARAARFASIEVQTFDPSLDQVIARAAAVLCMGGYNTFCEILTHDRSALMVPRIRPRREQWLRACRASALGLVSMAEDPVEAGHAGERDPHILAQKLEGLAVQDPPSSRMIPGLLGGLEHITEWVARTLDLEPRQGTGSMKGAG